MLSRGHALVDQRSLRLSYLKSKLNASYKQSLLRFATDLAILKKSLLRQSKKEVVVKGNAMVFDQYLKEPVNSITELKAGKELLLKFNFGSATVKVIKVIK